MDWDLKVPASWDLAELEHDAAVATTTAAAAGPSSAAGVLRHVNNAADATGGFCRRAPPGGSTECSVDLKLGGGLGECEGPGRDRRRSSRETAGAAAASSPAGGPAAGAAAANKRPRPAAGGGGQRCPPCAVDGCEADLSKCRDYHRRHKVCEAHSKTPVVVVAGREMRFCQQCSRFHLLAEFDETKRSCRKRLDGHNRRRRKPQPDPMTSASFITSQQGTRFSPFTTPRPEANWPGIIKTEESPYYSHQIPVGTSNRPQHFVGSTSAAYAKEGRRFPFLQEGEISFATGGVVLEAPPAVCQQPLLKTVVAAPPPPESAGGGSKMFSSSSDGGLMTRVLDSDCALSLLSAAPANSSAGIDVVGRMVRRSAEQQVPTMAQAHQQPLQVPVPQFDSRSSSWFSRPQLQATTTAVLEGEQQLNTTVLGANDGEMNYGGMFHVGGGAEGSSDGGTSSPLPFSWQ